MSENTDITNRAFLVIYLACVDKLFEITRYLSITINVIMNHGYASQK